MSFRSPIIAGLALLAPLSVMAAEAGPYVLTMGGGYVGESHDNNFDSTSMLASLGLQRQVGRWNYAGGLTYARRLVDVPAMAQDARSKIKGGYLSATGNLWHGGHVSVSTGYGALNTYYHPVTLSSDGDSLAYTIAASQTLPLGNRFSLTATTSYTYSSYRPDGASLANDSSQSLFGTGARVMYHGSPYQPFVSVTHRHLAHDHIGNDDRNFYDVAAGASLPLSKGRKLSLTVNTWLGMTDYERLGAMLTYSHPLR